jgi:hypothetical protein
MGARGSFPGSEADHSPPSSVEVKNAWSYTSALPKPLDDVVLRDNFTFTFMLINNVFQMQSLYIV